MKKAREEDEDMPAEIDFSTGHRGRFTGRVHPGAVLVQLEPDLTTVFPDAASVNAALRMVLRAGVHQASRELT